MSWEALLETHYVLFIVVAAIWEGIWKLFAMWRACKRDSKLWFVLIAFINTLGILPIFYLIFTREKD